MNPQSLRIEAVDPQGADALALMREAAIEARALYPDLHAPDAPFPDNPPTPPRGIYLLAYEGNLPIASGALRPIDETIVEIRRMYVLKDYRRQGIAQMILAALERESARLGYNLMRLETGYKQDSAMRLYEAYGFIRIPPFGAYVGDPSSVCFEKPVNPLKGDDQ
jgi:putative acetyltransferase